MEIAPLNLYIALYNLSIKMIIIRYSEIGLKGKNRRFFENKLIANIKLLIQKPVKNLRNRMIIKTDEKQDLSKIFGISSYSHADEIELDLEKINKKALSLAKNSDSFRISCQRIDKNIKFSSMEIQQKVGEFIFENLNIEVKLKNPEINIQIELFNNHAYIFTEKIKGPGGLPVGVEGKVVALIENNNSIKAALAVMKRGCEIIPVAFEKHDLSELEKYGLQNKLIIIKDLEDIEDIDAKALVVGQKLKDFKEIKTEKLVLRPLVAE